MRKVIVSGTMAVLIGLLLAVPLSAQTAGAPMSKAATQLQDMRMLVLVDRMNLSADQMQQLHTALTGIIDQAKSLKDLGASFRQDLINFHGTNDQLNALVDQYREKMHAAMADLHEKVKAALDSLKTSLTIEQGELLREALMPQAPRMGMMNGKPTWMGRSQNAPIKPGFRNQRPMEQPGRAPWGNRGEQFRMTRPPARATGGHPLLSQGRQLLQRIQELEKILELKLNAQAS